MALQGEFDKLCSVNFFVTALKSFVMGMLQQLQQWSTTHHPRWLVLLRIALGICLFFKGILFVNNIAYLQLLLSQSGLQTNSVWIALGIAALHLVGGFLIIAGLLTRWAVLIQIPILLGAVIFVNVSKSIYAGESELAFSVVILMLLIFFFIEGGGPFSLDDYFRKHPK